MYINATILQVTMGDSEGMEVAQGETGQLLGLLNKYETEVLSTTWVEAVIDTDYTECDALPGQFEEQHLQTNWISLLAETGGWRSGPWPWIPFMVYTDMFFLCFFCFFGFEE